MERLLGGQFQNMLKMLEFIQVSFSFFFLILIFQKQYLFFFSFYKGDATLVLPSHDIPKDIMDRLKGIIDKISKRFEITGPFNFQVIWKGDELKVIELNLRASRRFLFFIFQFPFVHSL